jgi:hypothetical protein
VFSAAANSGPGRTGTLNVAGQSFTVTQAARTRLRRLRSRSAPPAAALQSM